MRLNSLALRLFATSAAWTLLALPLAGYIIYSLYREDVQLSFDAQLRKLLTQITVDAMGTSGDVPVIPPNLYEPLFEVTQSGWYWQIRPIDGALYLFDAVFVPKDSVLRRQRANKTPEQAAAADAVKREHAELALTGRTPAKRGPRPGPLARLFRRR